MLQRTISLCALMALFACNPGDAIVFDEPEVLVPGEGWTDEAWADPTAPTPEESTLDPRWDDAVIRILSPDPSAVVSLGEPVVFAAELLDAEGIPLPVAETELSWFSNSDLDFHGQTLQFTSSNLAGGTHELTVVADLPNGDKVAHTIGGVRVQSAYAGTYSGLFSVDGEINGLVVTCTGVGTAQFGVMGTLGTGDGDCLVSLLGINVPLVWVFDLENDGTGVIDGTAGLDLVGILTYNFPAEGTLDPDGAGLSLTVDGTIPFVGPLTAFLEAPRVSLE